MSLLPNEPINPITSDALNSIQSTPFQNSFISRLHGLSISSGPVLAEDWDTISPWMSLMSDIRDHYALLQYVALLAVYLVLLSTLVRNATGC